MKTLLSALTQILYEADLANTSCKENECFDEYEKVAEMAITEFIRGVWPTLSEATESVMVHTFDTIFTFPESLNDSIDSLVK